jgi:hypothetical protein
MFGILHITTMNVIFGHSGTLPFAFLPGRSAKSVAGCSVPYLPFFLASRTSLAQLFETISTHFRPIHSALSKFSNSNRVFKVS